MKILRENLIQLLNFAIAQKSKMEKSEWGYTNDSCELAAWKYYLEEVKEGTHLIEIQTLSSLISYN